MRKTSNARLERVWLAKHLLCSDKGLSLVLRTLVKKKKCRVMVPACGAATRKAETGESLGLASQPARSNWLSSRLVRKTVS